MTKSGIFCQRSIITSKPFENLVPGNHCFGTFSLHEDEIRQDCRKEHDVKFSNREEFELNVHKCFGRIFELLSAIDAKVTEQAEKELNADGPQPMNDLRDKLEETILQCHLAWQYHRLSRMGSGSTWDQLENSETERAETQRD
jgi:hypothetical protein